MKLPPGEARLLDEIRQAGPRRSSGPYTAVRSRSNAYIGRSAQVFKMWNDLAQIKRWRVQAEEIRTYADKTRDLVIWN